MQLRTPPLLPNLKGEEATVAIQPLSLMMTLRCLVVVAYQRLRSTSEVVEVVGIVAAPLVAGIVLGATLKVAAPLGGGSQQEAEHSLEKKEAHHRRTATRDGLCAGEVVAATQHDGEEDRHDTGRLLLPLTVGGGSVRLWR